MAPGGVTSVSFCGAQFKPGGTGGGGSIPGRGRHNNSLSGTVVDTRLTAVSRELSPTNKVCYVLCQSDRFYKINTHLVLIMIICLGKASFHSKF